MVKICSKSATKSIGQTLAISHSWVASAIASNFVTIRLSKIATIVHWHGLRLVLIGTESLVGVKRCWVLISERAILGKRLVIRLVWRVISTEVVRRCTIRQLMVGIEAVDWCRHWMWLVHGRIVLRWRLLRRLVRLKVLGISWTGLISMLCRGILQFCFQFNHHFFQIRNFSSQFFDDWHGVNPGFECREAHGAF